MMDWSSSRQHLPKIYYIVGIFLQQSLNRVGDFQTYLNLVQDYDV